MENMNQDERMTMRIPRPGLMNPVWKPTDKPKDKPPEKPPEKPNKPQSLGSL